MGQQSSSSASDFVSQSFVKLICDDANYAFVPEEIITMNYDDFLSKLDELNKLSKTCLDTTGKQLLFAVKRGSDSTVFWKATVQIACVKVHPDTIKVDTYRLLNLREFLQVFSTLKTQHAVAEQSKSNDDKMTASVFYSNIAEVSGSQSPPSLETQVECCICLERKPDILLPCAHSYCLQCIEEWNEDHHTCPICREQVKSADDGWVLSEVPKAEEISEEIRTMLMNLAVDKQS